MTRRLTALTTALLLMLATGLAAQTPPAGNAHPDADVEAAADIVNPLMPAEGWSGSTATREQKRDFAAQVDLEAFRALAILTNGRVGIVDTAARDTIRKITGRRAYRDFIITPNPDGGDRDAVEEVNYDPVFTWLDMMADRDYYLDKPLIHVDFLPLREAILDMVFTGPDASAEIERWKKVGRLSPLMYVAHEEAIRMEIAADSLYSEHVTSLQREINRFAGTFAQLHIVAPADPEGDWVHASRDPQVAPLFARLGEAWRALDAPRVNTLLAEIAERTPTINASHYPAEGRRSLERFYNGASKFIVGYTLYFAALITLLIAFGTGRVWVNRLGILMLLAGLAIHAAGFAVRWILAERIPIQNQFESMLGLCLGAVLFGSVMMFARRQSIFGVAAAAVGFMTLMTATMTGIPGQEIGREAAILNTSYILFYHVNIVLFSYGLIALGMVVSLVYLVTHYLGGDHTAALVAAGIIGPVDETEQRPVNVGRERLLHDLDHAQMVILQAAFWILGVGILLGAWWADHSWGRWWAFDPKETWALITWIVYLIVIHVRFGVRNRGLVTAWLSIVGFIVMLWTYFGVNLLLPGLHAYA